MFADLMRNHSVFVNTYEHDIVNYDRVTKNATEASYDNLVHLYCFELNEDCEVESNVDVWLYLGYTFGEIDGNVFEVRRDGILHGTFDSLESCVGFVESKSKNA